jgi:hypothetical protein
MAHTGKNSKFKREYIQMMHDFFNQPVERREVIKSMVEYDENGEEKRKAEEYKILPAKFPSLYAFSRHIGVDFHTVAQWAEHGQDEMLERRKAEMAQIGVISKKDAQMQEDLISFATAYKQARQAQKDFLINVGLSGASPSAAFIFTAKNVTDMRDRVESEVSHRIVTPLLEHLSIDTPQNPMLNAGNEEE